MKTGVSSYSFYPALSAGRMRMDQVVDTVARLGFDTIDFSVLVLREQSLAEAVRLLGRQCRDAGLPVKNYAVSADFLRRPVQEEVERLKFEVDAAVDLGAQTLRHDATVGIPAGWKGPKSFDSVVGRLAEGYRRVTELAAQAGVRTMVENHGQFVQESSRVEKLICQVDHENFGALVDVGNFLCADEDPLHAVAILAPYAFHVHVKDFHVKPATAQDPGQGWFRSRSGKFLRGAIIGHGEVAVRPALELLKQAGYDGVAAIEFEGMEDCLLGVELGLRNLKSAITSLAGQ